ncbi:hypothetical protein ACHAPT_012150 [Fusarium lateritium]
MAPLPNDSEMEGAKKSQHGKSSSESQNGHMDLEEAAHEAVSQDIFGGQNGQNYRNMSRWDAFFALTTNQLGLGVLSLPAVFRTLGIVPALIAMVVIGTLTWYTGYELWQFFCRYPSVVYIVDMIRITGGRTWEVVAGIFLLIQLLMTCAAVSVTLSVAFNTLSQHGTCTVGFIGIACIGCWLLCVPRTVKFIAHSGVPCFLSILVSSLIVIISLGVEHPTRVPDQD